MTQTGKTVLVVDDFQNMRSVLRQIVSSIGLRDIDQAPNGEIALQQLQQRRYDVVLCDYNLGAGMDGQQLLNIARQEGYIDLATVFIMVTAEHSHDMVMGAIENAPDAYLTKPFTRNLLQTRLNRALRRREPLRPIVDTLNHSGPEAALAQIDYLIAQADGAASADLLQLKAQLALDINHLARAEEACQQALQSQPHAWISTALGTIALRLGDIATAESRYLEAITLSPNFMAAHDQLARLYETTGREPMAYQTLVSAVERSSKSLNRQRHLGRLALKLGQTEMAERSWLRALTLARQMGQRRATDQVGFISTILERGDVQKARLQTEVIKREFAADPEAPWWYVIARLWCAPKDIGAEHASILEQLDTQMAQQPPPSSIIPSLFDALERLGDKARIARLPSATTEAEDITVHSPSQREGVGGRVSA